ncbi:peptidylprolyl isomerase [Oceanicella actignis]|uniref:Parvulin-like PPIase n=1 Tax=Oceanicella actignis TaxID=1189325 RepID=A0A1M7TKV7_9RHOB|nr:peptidylprolyl isomerase [Oceanicella actignis]SET68436.1 peptidyl-prolyl cis-trans isomerase C [Oceanicella actignis]SHN71253.1 peptidyl-prolyl cis-trans isomerase C [Oceanicella actignis]
MPIIPTRRAISGGIAALMLATAPALADQPAQAPAADAAAGAADAQNAPVDPDAVVARVNGHEITLGDVILMRANLPPQYQALPDEQLYEALVEQIVTQTLLADKAREAGLDQSRLAKLRARADARNFLAEAQLRREIEKAVTEDALRAAYEKKMAERKPVEEVRARHILVKTKEEAEAVRKELLDGADFAELAKTRSTGPSGPRGGDLGWFEKDMMVPEFAEAAFALEPGEISEPVQTQFGWHVIKLEERREKPAPTFEEMREELAAELESEAARAAVDAVREGVTVERPEPAPAPAAIRRDDVLIPR